jgi:hypothetical protein
MSEDSFLSRAIRFMKRPAAFVTLAVVALIVATPPQAVGANEIDLGAVREAANACRTWRFTLDSIHITLTAQSSRLLNGVVVSSSTKTNQGEWWQRGSNYRWYAFTPTAPQSASGASIVYKSKVLGSTIDGKTTRLIEYGNKNSKTMPKSAIKQLDSPSDAPFVNPWLRIGYILHQGKGTTVLDILTDESKIKKAFIELGPSGRHLVVISEQSPTTGYELRLNCSLNYYPESSTMWVGAGISNKSNRIEMRSEGFRELAKGVFFPKTVIRDFYAPGAGLDNPEVRHTIQIESAELATLNESDLEVKIPEGMRTENRETRQLFVMGKGGKPLKDTMVDLPPPSAGVGKGLESHALRYIIIFSGAGTLAFLIFMFRRRRVTPSKNL